MTAYYNEFDPKAAAWLRELIAEGHIAPGVVDERSIEDVQPSDLAGFRQCHFFAGIGGWSLALRLASWPDDRPVWTGSCPCQPFSAAGKRAGTDDERHLWPALRWLIDQRRPAAVFGEQVASADGRGWLAGVRTDLEAMGYRVGAADLCSAGVGAPNIRQRLWWVADAYGGQPGEAREVQPRGEHGQQPQDRGAPGGLADAGRVERKRRQGEQRSGGAGSSERHKEGADDQRGCADSGVVHADGERRDGERVQLRPRKSRQAVPEAAGPGTGGRLPDPSSAGLPAPECEEPRGAGRREEGRAAAELHCAQSPWDNAIWIPCADGKARRIEPGLEPLVTRLPGRVGLLRGYGNAINPYVACEFVMAYLESNP